MKIGIYCIENIVNHKKYIGQSINIEQRWIQHKQIANRASSDRSHYFLYQAIQKYGINNFIFYIIEECTVDELDEKEKYWISYYNTYKNGYNMTLGGSGFNGCYNKRQNILPKNFSLLNSNNELIKVAKLSKDYKILKIYPSVQEAARDNKVQATNISKTMIGKHKYCGDYIYMYYDSVHDLDRKSIVLRRMSDLIMYESNLVYVDGYLGVINELDCDGNIIQIFNNMYEIANKYNLDLRSIKKVCSKIIQQTNGYYFEYNKDWYLNYLDEKERIESELWWQEQYNKIENSA